MIGLSLSGPGDFLALNWGGLPGLAGLRRRRRPGAASSSLSSSSSLGSDIRN